MSASLDRRIPVVVLIAFFGAAGCQSPLDVGLTWGGAGRAAVDSAKSPLVWAPAAGALVFQIDDWDHRASDWAIENTPVFGSNEDAKDASDVIRDVAIGLGVGLTVVSPEPGEPDAFATRKTWRVGLAAGALGVTSTVTDELKDATDRTRPDGGSRSFPSAHTSASAAASTLALDGFKRHDIPVAADVAGQAALITLPYAVGWARVEAGRHYPSDVLAGAALGNFFAGWVNELLDPEDEDGATINVTPTDDGVQVGVTLELDRELACETRQTARLRAAYTTP